VWFYIFFGSISDDTLGSPCPWPTIGAAMSKEYPAANLESWRGSSASHILANPNENNSMEIIEKWLEHCVKQHPSCRQELEANNSSPLPKRVINVGPDGNSGIHIFEHDDDNSPVKGQYVALSHCWGITKHILTLMGNIEDWKKNIPWNILHSTFQEAIAIARRLGIRYLWIDSLCIIQDDSKDWNIEAAKMGSIYSRAYLVIAATGAVDGNGGIFIKKVPYITLRGEDQHQKQFEIFVRHQLDHRSFGWDVTYGETQRATRYKYRQTINPGYPLFTRAWCFQERVLGSRVLHFTRDELIFECISSLSCECGALADFSDDWILPARNFVSSRHLQDASSDLQGYAPTLGNLPELTMQNLIAKGFSIFAEWYDLASEYSEKQITRSTDWLPALAGLATKWEGPKTGNYLSGLWSKDLLRGLSWESLAPEINENSVYIAPSWSWASTQRPVHWIQKFPRSKYFVEINLQKTACIAKGPNKFGELAVGWLFITGPVIYGTLTSVHPGGRPRGLAAYVQSNGSTQCFSMDSRSRCSEFIGQKITCLRYCTDMSSDSSSQYNRTLMLAHVRKDDKELSGLPDNIRDFPNICRRIGIQEACRTDLWHFDSRCTLISMYII